jgi:hypothetical protein
MALTDRWFLKQPGSIWSQVVYEFMTLDRRSLDRARLYSTKAKLRTNEQFGFKEKSTTDKATHTLLNNIQLSSDKKKKGVYVEYFVTCKRYLIV